MPSKERDRESSEVDERPKERRRESKSERRPDGEREREHRRHKSSRSSKTKASESDVQSSSHRRRRTKEERDRDRDRDRDQERPPSPTSEMADVVPELNRSKERVNVPYPSFSKAHSKENIHSREDLSAATGRRTDPLTPEPTDVGAEEMKRSKSADYSGSRKPSTRTRSNTRTDERPPSPPDTNLSGSKERRTGTPSSSDRRREKDAAEERPRSRTSWFSRPGSRQDDKSKLSTKSKTSSQATYVMSPAGRIPYAESAREEDSVAGEPTGEARRTPSGQAPRPAPIEVVDFSPESAQDSSPKTPTQTPQFPPHILPDDKHEAPSVPFSDAGFRSQTQTPATDFGAPPPPPPPPPPTLHIQEAPRVDYLMQHGGLPHMVPRNFLAVLPRQNGNRPSNPPLQGAETLFAPFFNLLNQYHSVLTSHGSIAVATGHRTVARRLLDRLENVFSRDLPAEGCSCVICDRSDAAHRGLGWGEVLERVSGRIEIPSWPPFDFADVAHKSVEAVEVPRRPASPVKMDPDIAEELRGHYLRQNKKTRATVDHWMANCAQSPAPPPQEIDDETLTFAILTTLEQEDRPYFIALLTGSRELQPSLRAPTPLRKPRQDFVVRSGLAIQRLYRLGAAPRDAETILYLIKNHHIHDLLHTISDINPSEWEILVSGRFDGFLWSGADDDVPTPTAETPSRGATPASGFFPPTTPLSRGGTMSPALRMFSPLGGGGTRSTTPFSAAFSRGTTPASFVSGTSTAGGSPRAAVSHDEDTEVAALAELEREIYVGMEALEDAFETLHHHAQTVRTALRQRGAGLALAMQQRRGGSARSIDVLPQSSASRARSRADGVSGGISTDEETSDFDASDWGGDEFDIVPEDSASNISSSRRRRPIRRNERRTPAPIEEEDE